MTKPSKPSCEHLLASVVASGALVLSTAGHVATGSLRWCPECGSIRSETFGLDGHRVIGVWMPRGDGTTIEASAQALRDEAARNARRTALGDGLDAARQALGLPLQGDHA